jgi:DNA processing protein
VLREEYWYWICNMMEIDNGRKEKLIRFFGDMKELYFASSENLRRTGILTEKQTEYIINTRKTEKIEREYESLLKKGIRFVSRENPEYPEELRQLEGGPYGLFVKGGLPVSKTGKIAVVGARKATPYGLEITRYYSRFLASNGIDIISGMALGIDAEAHRGALEAGGKTYAVLGCGVDVCYPRSSTDIYYDIQSEENGGIISEYPPGCAPLARNFPMRNRLISGLSRQILVMEARERSGSLITAALALEQGKDIYALPGRATDPFSLGCNWLISQGAGILLQPADFMEKIGIYQKEKVKPLKKNNKLLDIDEKMVYSCLSLEPKNIEYIIQKTNMSVNKVMQILVKLESQELIRKTLANAYIIIMQ